jgi:hypothetical protein
MHLRKSTLLLVGLIASTLVARSSSAILLYDKSYRNKSAPTGSYANSGWQFTGNWGSFLGVPIAKNYFIAASHVGGGVGQNFTLNGKNYKVTGVYNDPNSDLNVYKVSTNFSSWASLYTGSTEVGKTAMLFGRGTGKGAEVKVGSTRKGWKWGTADHLKSWGRNKIRTTVNGGSGLGSVLGMTFDRTNTNGGDKVDQEGIFSAGDSSGAVFINSSNKWYLAGIIYSVETPYKTSASGSAFDAAIFDKGGLYYSNALVSDTTNDKPAYMYASRISTNRSWINSVIGASAGPTLGAVVPEPASMSLLMAGLALLGVRRRV